MTLARGLAILDDETRELPAGGAAARRGGVQALRHLRLSARPDPGGAARPRHEGRRGGLRRAPWRSQRAEARKAWAGSGEAATDAVWFGLRDRVGADRVPGLRTERGRGHRHGAAADGRRGRPARRPGESGQVLLNQTPFYAESGGQVGDTGTMRAPGVVARVTDTHKKLGDLFVHEVTVERGRVDGRHGARSRGRPCAPHAPSGRTIRRRICCTRRCARCSARMWPRRDRSSIPTACASTSRTRSRSRRGARRGRGHRQPIVLQNEPVVTRLMGIEEARASGARALFGEKYGDEVRVVSMGRGEAGGAPRRLFDRALRRHPCGAHRRHRPHLGHRRERGRRRRAPHRGQDRRSGAAPPQRGGGPAARPRGPSEAPPELAAERLAALVEERRRLERELAEARKRLALGGGAAGRRRAAARRSPASTLGPRGDRHRHAGPQGPGRRGQEEPRLGRRRHRRGGPDGKAGLVVAVTPDLTTASTPSIWCGSASEKLGGKGGGGRPDMAQAGGPDGAAAEAALDAVEAALQSIRSPAARKAAAKRPCRNHRRGSSLEDR